MSFQDVDGVKGDFVFVLIVELVEGRNLPPEGRSGVAAEDEDDRLLAAEGTELNMSRLVEGGESEVGSHITGLNRTSAGVCPQGFERQSDEGDHWSSGHDAAELFRRLVHGVIKEDDAGQPEASQDHSRFPGDFTDTLPVDVRFPQRSPHRLSHGSSNDVPVYVVGLY